MDMQIRFYPDQGVLVHFQDGTQTLEFLKTKIEVLGAIQQARKENRIKDQEQYSLWRELYDINKKFLPVNDEFDELFLILLIQSKGPLTFAFFKMETLTKKDQIPHGYIWTKIQNRTQALPIEIITRHGGRTVVEMMMQYDIITKKVEVILRKDISSCEHLPELASYN